jgi:alpha-D-xyloside xylohydrolase
MPEISQSNPIFLHLYQDKVLSIQPDPFTCSILDEKSVPIWQLVAVRFNDLEGTWHSADCGKILDRTDNSVSFLVSSQTSPVKLQGKCLQEEETLFLEFISEPQNSASWMCLNFRAEPDEHFLGLGERFDQLDQRGNQVVLKVINGATGGRTYKPIPFFISSKGYGVQLLNSAQSVLRLAAPDDSRTTSIRTQTSAMKVRLFSEGTSKDILTAYTSFCGRQELPPPWVFGPWKSRDWTTENQQTAEEDIVMGRYHHLAGTVKLIDAAWETYNQCFTFDEKRWPDPDALIHKIHQLGYKLILWISPWLFKYDEDSPTYTECVESGYFIKNPDGEVYVHRLANSPDLFGTCIDFTNPEACSWWQDHIRRIVHLGVDGFKTDFGEQIPDDAVFYDGSTGHEMHNLYPVLYNRLTYEALNAETQGVLLARSAWDGAQPYCVLFAGDQSSDFSPAGGLQSVIIAGQSAGLSGFPYWTCDIGGYFGSPTEEVFIRWAQFGAFCPIMQVHGIGIREPWKFSERTLDIYKKYAQIHMDLFPYIYTYAKIASETGLPIMRALPLEFPDDENVWGDLGSHEYCFGDALLVAPVYYGLSEYRLTYLPEGIWRDFWSGKFYLGGQNVRLESPLDVIPVMAKAGSIIPFLDPSAETLLPVEDPLTPVATDNLSLQIYPGQDGKFMLYDQTLFVWTEKTLTLEIFNSPIDRYVSVKIFTEEFEQFALQALDEEGKAIPLMNGNLNADLDYSRISITNQKNYSIQWMSC